MLPYFYLKNFDASQSQLTLDEDNSRHAIQVLRMKKSQSLHITDGLGRLATCSIISDNKKHCGLRLLNVKMIEQVKPEVTIAISITKNQSRLEWFLEKAAELGITGIVPLISKRTENRRFKSERLHNILISAMLQSQQSWLTQLAPPQAFEEYVLSDSAKGFQHKFVAHCADGNKQSLTYQTGSSLILIGPEGDFTGEEIQMAVSNGYIPVSLGSTRLRTETAGIAAAAVLRVQ